QELPEQEHDRQSHEEGQDPVPGEVHVRERYGPELDADVPELDAEGHGRGSLQEEEHATGDEELVDRRGIQYRPDDDRMQDHAGHGDDQDADQHGERKGQADDLVEMEDGVHADHHQLGVADPDDVDHPEHQVEAEGEQGQQSREQNAVEHGFEEEDV